MEEKHPQYINSIIRAVKILELYGKLNTQYLGIAEISNELKLQRTTTFNIVKTLLHEGWLVQDSPNGKYRLGTRILQVSAMVTRNTSTEDMIQEEMHRLRDMYNEDVVLTKMIDGIPVCVEKVQSSNVLRIESKVGRAGNLLKGSTGKTLFAWQPEKFINSVLDAGFADSPKGTEEKESLRAELQKIREQGFCVSISEQNEGVASVSVPIRDKSGYAVYSLAVIGEEKRVKQKNMEEIAKVLMDSARGLEGARSQTE